MTIITQRNSVRHNIPFKDIDSKVGWTVTSLEVENWIFSSALRSIPPSAMLGNYVDEFDMCLGCDRGRGCDVGGADVDEAVGVLVDFLEIVCT